MLKVETKMTGWLSLLCTEEADEAEELCRTYPWLAEIYREMDAYSLRPEEVLGMFSEALREMDRNTVKYMVEQQQKTIQDQATKLEEKDILLSKKDSLLAQKDHEIERLRRIVGKNNMLHDEA